MALLDMPQIPPTPDKASATTFSFTLIWTISVSYSVELGSSVIVSNWSLWLSATMLAGSGLLALTEEA